MVRYRTLTLLVATLLWSTPATAALTRSAGSAEEGPRLGWLERFQEARQGVEQTDRVSETHKVGADAVLDVSHVSGDVRVNTGKTNEIRIEAVKRVRHRNTDEGKRLLGLLRVDVTQTGSRLEIRTIYPRTSGRSLSASVDYTITVPATAAISVKTVSGDVAVNGVRGEVRAETVSGDVDVVETPNLVIAKAVSGDVRARDIGTATSLTLSTVSGSVIASALKVRTLEAGSVSGNVELTNLDVERLLAKTINGDITYGGVVSRGGRYEFNAHSGDVRIALVNPAGFELDASTFSGSIRSDFPITLRTTSREERGSRNSSSRAVRGTFGDASAVLSVRSFSGTVVITKK
jgi:DUF4097 and DUF4098 domain-containing protein YvlB